MLYPVQWIKTTVAESGHEQQTFITQGKTKQNEEKWSKNLVLSNFPFTKTSRFKTLGEYFSHSLGKQSSEKQVDTLQKIKKRLESEASYCNCMLKVYTTFCGLWNGDYFMIE